MPLLMEDGTTYVDGVLEGTSPSFQHLVCGNLSLDQLIQLSHTKDVLFQDPYQGDLS